MTKNEVAETIQEMMEAWNKIMAAAREHFPNANEDELYNIAKNAMDKAVGIAAA